MFNNTFKFCATFRELSLTNCRADRANLVENDVEEVNLLRYGR